MAYLNNQTLFEDDPMRIAEVFCESCDCRFRGKINSERTDGEFRYLQFVDQSSVMDRPWYNCPECDEITIVDYYHQFAEN